MRYQHGFKQNQTAVFYVFKKDSESSEQGKKIELILYKLTVKIIQCPRLRY